MRIFVNTTVSRDDAISIYRESLRNSCFFGRLTVNVLAHLWDPFGPGWTPWPWSEPQASAFVGKTVSGTVGRRWLSEKLQTYPWKDCFQNSPGEKKRTGNEHYFYI